MVHYLVVVVGPVHLHSYSTTTGGGTFVTYFRYRNIFIKVLRTGLTAVRPRRIAVGPTLTRQVDSGVDTDQ